MQRALVSRVAARRPAVAASTALYTTAARSYQMGPFFNVDRRPQLSDDERSKVVINQEQWPAEFKDYDPQDPYKNTPDYIEGMTTFDLWLLGVEAAFILTFFELVFPYSM
eukprot:PhM_4_TR12688/c0_g1_i1/m.17146